MIEFKNISKNYGEKQAVTDLCLTVPTGSLCVLIGPSGCGKTTSLKMVNRLIEPSSGHIFLNGKDVTTQDPVLLRRKIGYVIQDIGLFPHHTVAENIATVPELLRWNAKKINSRVDELLSLVGLEPAEYRHKKPRALSGGEAQRIGVARALAADPDFLLMDEPFGSVDPLNRETLQEEFLKIQRRLKKTVIFVTHDLSEAIRLGDMVVVMKNGTVIQKDSPDLLLGRPQNDFVRDFVGTDRGLLRLSRLFVGDYMNLSPVVLNENDTGAKVQPTGCPDDYAWVTDQNGQLSGWVSFTEITKNETVSDVMTRESKRIAVYSNTCLKDALNRMLDQNLQSLPVINEEKKLVGSISFEDIQHVFKPARGIS